MDENDGLNLPLPETKEAAAFMGLGLIECVRTLLDYLERAAPHQLSDAKTAALRQIKGCVGEGGTSIEDESEGIGAAIAVATFLFDTAIARASGSQDGA